MAWDVLSRDVLSYIRKEGMIRGFDSFHIAISECLDKHAYVNE